MRAKEVGRALSVPDRHYPKFQVFWTIVCTIAVLVMDRFTWSHRTTKQCGHHNSVFGLKLWLSGDENCKMYVSILDHFPLPNVWRCPSAPIALSVHPPHGRSSSSSPHTIECKPFHLDCKPPRLSHAASAKA